MKKIKIYYIILLISSMISFSCSPDKNGDVIGLKQNIHHDDFEYSVTGFEKADIIVCGNDTIRPSGIFYFVHFRVINNALRVGHSWDNSIACIIDDQGNRYENCKGPQIALNKSLSFGWKESYDTPHGQTDTTILVFDLPINASKPCLKVRGSILMGDVFDAGRFLRMKIRLY